jgi:hypothetical protein
VIKVTKLRRRGSAKGRMAGKGNLIIGLVAADAVVSKNHRSSAKLKKSPLDYNGAAGREIAFINALRDDATSNYSARLDVFVTSDEIGGVFDNNNWGPHGVLDRNVCWIEVCVG